MSVYVCPCVRVFARRQQNTRAAVLSPANPYYFAGSVAAGVGSPHTGPGRVWPMAVMSRAWTSTNETEIAQSLQTLVG